MSLLLVGSLALTLALLLGTFLVTHGHMRAGFLFLACLQLPAGGYDVATGQYGFVLMSLIGGTLYLRGWRRTGATDPENPPALRARRAMPKHARTRLAGDSDARAAPSAWPPSAKAPVT